MQIGIIIYLVFYIALLIYFVLTTITSGKAQKNKANQNHPVNYDSIFYDEDDYRQVEIVPAENFNELIKQAENIQDFSDKHFNGVGYTAMMIREDKELKLKDRGIKPDDLEAVLSKLLLQRQTVATGISPGQIKCNNTFGFGENYNGLFYEYEPDIVLNIWIAGTIPADKEKVMETLYEIGHKWNLLLMNWNSLQQIDLKNKEQIARYLNNVL